MRRGPIATRRKSPRAPSQPSGPSPSPSSLLVASSAPSPSDSLSTALEGKKGIWKKVYCTCLKGTDCAGHFLHKISKKEKKSWVGPGVPGNMIDFSFFSLEERITLLLQFTFSKKGFGVNNNIIINIICIAPFIQGSAGHRTQVEMKCLAWQKSIVMKQPVEGMKSYWRCTMQLLYGTVNKQRDRALDTRNGSL